ncbi:MAG: radical SAM protein [Nitrospirota bacterium]
MIIREIKAKTILSKSGIPGADYCLNPYIGCSHGCRYCYATFMKKFTGHTEVWGSFVDVKVNSPELLQKEMRKAAKGNVMISSVTDPYQPVEAKYRLIRRCLEILLQYQFPVDILTKSPLVLRDIDLFRKFRDLEAGITITTDNDPVRKVFEPGAPPVNARLNALKKLHEGGIRTYAFIGPVLPMNPDVLAERISPYADSILIDRMNYVPKTIRIYKSMNLYKWLDRDFIDDIIRRLKKGFKGKDISIC